MTVHELRLKYGSQDAADAIVQAKEGDEQLQKTQVRFHPDAPGVSEPRL